MRRPPEGIDTVLIVDDEEDIRDVLSLALADHWRRVFCAKDGREGLTLYRREHPPVVLTDTHCIDPTYVSGDVGSDGVLSPGELWTYVCTTTLTADTTNVATATGQDSLGNPVEDTDRERVDVVSPSVAVTKVATPTIVLAGELVAYTYQVDNTGDTPLAGVQVLDDACLSPGYVSGDGDGDGFEREPGDG